MRLRPVLGGCFIRLAIPSQAISDGRERCWMAPIAARRHADIEAQAPRGVIHHARRTINAANAALLAMVTQLSSAMTRRSTSAKRDTGSRNAAVEYVSGNACGSIRPCRYSRSSTSACVGSSGARACALEHKRPVAALDHRRQTFEYSDRVSAAIDNAESRFFSNCSIARIT